MREGTIPAKTRREAGKDVWVARLSDVTAYRDEQNRHVRLADLAGELGVSYHEARSNLRRLIPDILQPTP